MTTFDAVPDQVETRGMVAGVYRALKPGGTWLCVDIAASRGGGPGQQLLRVPKALM